MRGVFLPTVVAFAIAGFTALGIVAYKYHQSFNKTEHIATANVAEALTFFKVCNARRRSTLDSREHSFGAWVMTCTWREK